MYKIVFLAALTTSLFASCQDSTPYQGNEGEVITTVELRFVPAGGGEAIVATFDDPDGDGGDPPTVDNIALPPGEYDLSLKFENRLEMPPEDITVEIMDEGFQHQIFFTGSAVDGPSTDNATGPLVLAYDDLDVNQLPIGLQNTVRAREGMGEMIVTLRHLPPIGETPVKTSTLASELRESGFSGIGGESDVQVRFQVQVL